MSDIKYLSSKNMKYYSLVFYKKEKNFDFKKVQQLSVLKVVNVYYYYTKLSIKSLITTIITDIYDVSDLTLMNATALGTYNRKSLIHTDTPLHVSTSTHNTQAHMHTLQNKFILH